MGKVREELNSQRREWCKNVPCAVPSAGARVGMDFDSEEIKRTVDQTSCGNMFQLVRQMESVHEERKRERKRAHLVSSKAPDGMLKGLNTLLDYMILRGLERWLSS